MNTPTIYTATPADLSPPVQTDSFCVELVLATDYQKLKDEFKQLAAENVGMDGFVEEMLAIAWQGGSADGSDIQEIALRYGLIQLEVYCADKHENCVYDPGNFDDGDAVYFRTETPATDRIVAGIKADGVEMFVEKCREESMRAISSDIRNNWWLAGEHAEDFAAKLREGADK
ncbi:hypothetical protein [Klebsiella quasipneumoniae]|uniref:hypothetical protein n=1 Tax=Klebsiella quasipneumoniae TaxID=1463165 RepID=UPI0021530056|nr:hypothetical protein [Klebsiella quasipneumoniae]